MRIFISLNFDKQTKEQIKKYKNDLQNLLNNNESRKIKWEDPGKYHLTMFFVGEVEDSVVGKICKSLDSDVKLKKGAIELEFDKISAFPNMQNPRILYLDVKEEGGKLFELSKGISIIMGNNGFKQDKKFIPHVTIGRIRNNERIRMDNVKIACAGERFSAREFSIMKSTLRREGAVHEEVFKIELKSI